MIGFVSSANLAPDFNQLDKDHEDLHTALSEVSQNFSLGSPHLADSLIVLIGCLSAHFRLEEAIMERLDYNALGNHRKQHAILERGFKDILRDIEMGQFTDTTKALYEVFEEGLEKHTAQSDSLLTVADESRQSGEALGSTQRH